MDKILDCMGLSCPLPVVKTKKEFESFTEKGTLTVKVDNETAVKNLSRLAANSGFEVASKEVSDNAYEVRILVDPEKKCCCADEANKKKITTVVIASSEMGTGDEELGKSLLKMFIFSLTNATELPANVIFYNSGVKLAVEGSDSVEDLRNLEKAGVKIQACGTCLKHYGLSDKLQVGVVSNMYDIVEILTSSDCVIRP
ncbi:selenium metabolism protein YedF [Lachnospiraceae bacterium JC7]|nr:selenium metabolism protein YedF [Lachnospiraceae bacterium JC7]